MELTLRFRNFLPAYAQAPTQNFNHAVSPVASWLTRSHPAAMSVKEFIQNSAMLVGFLVACYVVARVVGTIAAAAAARRLAPLAPTVNGKVEMKRGVLTGTYEGRSVVVSYSPKETFGYGETQRRMKAIRIVVIGLQGKADWWLDYHVTGALGQGPKRLQIGTRKTDGLAERLAASGVVAEVEASNAGTNPYMAVRYECYLKTLTYIDEVSTGDIPTLPVFERQLKMAVRLADINEQLNR